MKFAFIDYENLNSLDSLNLAQYQKIFLFIGANQHQIQLSEKFNDALSLSIITVKNIAKNNLDFHITYYLGKLDSEVDKEIEFDILSKDKGYEGICEFIQHQRNGRICRLIAIKAEENKTVTHSTSNIPNNITPDLSIYYQEYFSYFISKNSSQRPKKIKTLRNDIISRLSIRNNVIIADKIIQLLVENKYIKITENTLVHLK